MDARISNKSIPPPEMTLEKKRTTPARLPRIAAPLEHGTILTPAKPSSRTASYEAKAGSIARSLGSGSSPSSPSSLRSSLTQARDQLLTPEQQKILQPEYISNSMLQLVQSALRTPFGAPFRQTFAARARAKALGTPHSDLDVVSYAIGAVARLAAASVQEDTFGTVHRDVAAILRALARVTGEVQTFVRMGPVHWTDVGFGGGAAATTAASGANGTDAATAARHVQEVEALLTHLRCALTFLIASFEGYAKDMGLGEVELREARKAAGLVV